jgi:hypothetical protein
VIYLYKHCILGFKEEKMNVPKSIGDHSKPLRWTQIKKIIGEYLYP